MKYTPEVKKALEAVKAAGDLLRTRYEIRIIEYHLTDGNWITLDITLYGKREGIIVTDSPRGAEGLSFEITQSFSGMNLYEAENALRHIEQTIMLVKVLRNCAHREGVLSTLDPN